MSGQAQSFLKDIYDIAKENRENQKSGKHSPISEMLIRIFHMNSKFSTSASEMSKKGTILGRIFVEESVESSEIASPLALMLCRTYTAFVITAINMHQSVERFDEIRGAMSRMSVDSLLYGKLIADYGYEFEQYMKTGKVGTTESMSVIDPTKTPTAMEKFQVSQFYTMRFLVKDDSSSGLVEWEFPINVMLLPARLQQEAVQHIVAGGNPESLFRRLIKVIVGEINPFLDFVLCRDIIKANKDAIKQDNNNVIANYYDDLLKKKRKNMLNLFTGRIQNNLANSIMVVDENTMREACHIASVDLMDNRADIARFMEENFMIMLAIVDQSHGLVKVHINAIDDPIEVGFETLKTMGSSGKGVSVEQLTKVLAMGNAPRF